MSSIRSQMLRGIKWTGLSTIIVTIFQIVQFALLGRIMSLSDFGLVGMITTVVAFSQIFLDMGVGAAVVQKEVITERSMSTLFWLNMIAGMIIFIFFELASPLISDYFHRNELVELLRILGILFLIAPLGQQSQYLLQKELRFNLLGAIEAASTIVSFLTLLILTFTIRTIYAYVISQVVLFSLKGILYFISYQKTWRPSFVFDPKECKELLTFGGFQLASRLVNRIGSNMDVILIGKYMGAEALGIYNLAYQIVTIPVLKINPILTRVAFPVFSKNQKSSEALNEGFLHMTKLLSLVSFPILMGLVAVSNVFILTIFGEKWVQAIPIVQIMAIVGILRVLMNPNGSIILAKGMAKIAFYWDAGVLILYGVALLVAVSTNSLVIVACTYVLVSIVNFLFGRQLLKWLIQLSWRNYIKSIKVPFALSLIITVTAYLVKEIVNQYVSTNSMGPLIISVSISAGLYITFLIRIYPHYFTRWLKKQLRGR
ncbi:teichuronic acid biosynthesis protein TuaB [Heyndrickxia camelliae]|uniref:Colanic acid exporter n=1 Tax=Heyndrickxia camelliae TaxID=1707093 RepID=A0A2N3LJ48_9BACI|nr:MOP flippase family protein [Heyndrickxia camelliae]PKR84605.1 colanic acid exporter [Heyndrickxia camelliae]